MVSVCPLGRSARNWESHGRHAHKEVQERVLAKFFLLLGSASETGFECHEFPQQPQPCEDKEVSGECLGLRSPWFCPSNLTGLQGKSLCRLLLWRAQPFCLICNLKFGLGLWNCLYLVTKKLVHKIDWPKSQNIYFVFHATTEVFKGFYLLCCDLNALVVFQDASVPLPRSKRFTSTMNAWYDQLAGMNYDGKDHAQPKAGSDMLSSVSLLVDIKTIDGSQWHGRPIKLMKR